MFTPLNEKFMMQQTTSLGGSESRCGGLRVWCNRSIAMGEAVRRSSRPLKIEQIACGSAGVSIFSGTPALYCVCGPDYQDLPLGDGDLKCVAAGNHMPFVFA